MITSNYFCCDHLIREHQAQLFNYLKVSGVARQLANLRQRRLGWKRLQSNEKYEDMEGNPRNLFDNFLLI